MTSADEESIFPDWVAEEMPYAGPCAFCGGPDKRHRVVDSLVGAIRAGDPLEEMADIYGYTVPFVQRLVDEIPESDLDWHPDTTGAETVVYVVTVYGEKGGMGVLTTESLDDALEDIRNKLAHPGKVTVERVVK